jgi:hypothetical protein
MMIRGLALASVFAIPVLAQSATEAEASDSVWTVGGTVGAEFGYHSVVTGKNESGLKFVNGKDTILPGKKYRNYFQVPGIYGAWNAFVQVQSPTGQKMEFTFDASRDAWNHFDLKYLQASYEDDLQKVVLGDAYVSGGELYMAGLDFFGLGYDINLNLNNSTKPLLAFSVFGGENRAPKLPYDKDPDQYNQYIDLDEVEAQKMVIGGKLLWNATKDVDATFGFIGSKDYLEDPFLRDGTSKHVNLADPLASSKTFFGEVNGTVFGGQGTYNLQLGLGGADTANVVVHRAVNAIFEEAGLDVSSFAQLRRLMNNTSLVNRMNREDLELIFGESTGMSVAEMRSELIEILKLANEALKKRRDENSDDPTDWTAQNLAFSGSYNWKRNATTVDAFFRFVGRNYYSAGSSDLLQNSRRFGLTVDHKLYDFWKLNTGYSLNIENASGSGDAYNVIGFAEGSKLGLVPGADDDWLMAHEQDEVRTLYIHDFNLKNTFKLSDSVELTARYALNYRTRSMPRQLRGNFFVSSGIYSDSWFAPRNGKPTINVDAKEGSFELDSARWAQYDALKTEPFLATDFEERLVKHTIELGATIKFPKNVLKVGGVWTFRRDMSRFNNDDLLDGFDFSNSTYGILGYYYHGSDFFEMRYPISLKTTLERFHNTASFTPRYRSYTRNDVDEFEWNLMDNATILLNPGFLDLMLHGGIRQNFMGRDEDNRRIKEMEMDLDLSAGVKIQLTEKLNTELNIGTFFNYRPDAPSEDYRDIYFSAAVNYDF